MTQSIDDVPGTKGANVNASLMEPTMPSRTSHRRSSPTRGLSVTITVDDREIVTVRVEGQLDIYTTTRLRQRMARFDLGRGSVVIDVSGVTLIDSSGLGTLLSLANRARVDGARLPLICTPEVADILQIARLTDAFDLTIVDGAATGG